MNILFVHGNFPGQFKDIAPSLARNIDGKTYFLTQSDNPQNIELPGVYLRQFELHRDVREEIHDYVKSAELAVLRGQAVMRALHQLHQQEGFVPDVVICHGGMGFGLFIKALIPTVRLVSYMEWFFTYENSRALFNEMTVNDHCRLESRNIPVFQELIQADVVVCPTQWQRQQFPSFIREHIKVIFDGVDLEYFCPGLPSDPFVIKSNGNAPLRFSSDHLLLTYGTRGMEPLRGFPEFMRAAAAAQQVYPQLHVIVFGSDRVAYSYPSQHSSGSWKNYMLEELDGSLDLNRLHFTGLINYGDLVRLFRRSDLHCYFTRPYVLSWGVFQAAASGCRLLVNNFPGISDVFDDPSMYPVVDLDNQDMINGCVLSQLGSDRNLQGHGQNLKKGLDLNSSLTKWCQLLDSLN